MNNITDEQMRTASPETIFEQQKNPSNKAIEAMKNWRDKEAESEMEEEWCDSVVTAMKQAQKEEW